MLTAPKQTIGNLIDTLYQVHCDNSRLQYFARDLRHKSLDTISIMPLTPFVYEFFLFNSLYQVDWFESFNTKELKYHPSKHTESMKQIEFTKYLMHEVKKNPCYLYRAFEPLIYLPAFEGRWIQVTPDDRVSKARGLRFFDNIKRLKTLVESEATSSDMQSIHRAFGMLDEGVHFIYMVRNNIFHGSKTLGDIYDNYQKQRVTLYEIFLKCITSLFFLVNDKRQVASDFIPCPISSRSLPVLQDGNTLDQYIIWDAMIHRLMKIGDTRLIAQFTKLVEPPRAAPNNKSALFYPSSGQDILTPLLLGLPYCTQFYFYDKGKPRYLPSIKDNIGRMPTVEFHDSKVTPRWARTNKTDYLEFAYDGIQRNIYWVHADNLDFLKTDAELRFYFHRGDSVGEGGSDQKWDSDHIQHLTKMIPKNQSCVFLTDGHPGGIDCHQVETCLELAFPFLERDRKYYYGIIKNKMG